MQQKGEIENEWVGQLFEQFPILEQLGICRSGERVQFVDTNQCVFVGRVAMKEFMLHQTG